MADTIPPPPAGYVLQSVSAPPPPPDGYVLQAPASVAPVVANSAHPEDVPYADGTAPYTAADLNPAAMAPERPKSVGEIAQDVGRSVVLGTRGPLRGAASIPDIVAAPAAYYINGGLDRAGVDPSNHQITFGEGFDKVWDKLGLPVPETPGERIVDRAGQALGGAFGGNGVAGLVRNSASPVARAVAESTLANPLVQGVGAITSGASAGTAHELGAGPAGEIAAGLAGGFLPVVPQIAQESWRQLFRGGEGGRQAVEDAISNFGAAGTSPTVGQATGSRARMAVESMLSKAPGAAGVMANKAAQQADEIQQGVGSLASRLSPASEPAQAGLAIERGITGQGGFVDRFKKNATSLYDQLDQYLPQTARVPVENTRAALAELTAPIPGAPATSQFFRNGKIADIAGAVDADTVGPMAPLNRPDVVSEVQRRQFAAADQNAAIERTNSIREALGLKPKPGVDPNAEIPQLLDAATDGRLPYAAVKKLRTLVGDELANPSLASDVKSSAWDKLYQGLTADLQGAAKQAGPEAEQAWSRANNYYRAGQKRIEALDRVVDKAGGPEAVYNAATSGTRDGAFQVGQVMKSLQPDQQKVLSATVLRRLGQATAGQAEEQGDFSLSTFLTNWNKLSPQARSVMFDRYGPDFRSDLDSIAKVAGSFRAAQKVGANPSGSGAALAQQGALGTFIGSALLGNYTLAGGTAATVVGSNLLARSMTSPTFVKFLARSTNIPRSQWPGAIDALARTAADKGDEDAADAAARLKQALKQTDNRKDNPAQK